MQYLYFDIVAKAINIVLLQSVLNDPLGGSATGYGKISAMRATERVDVSWSR